MIIHGGLDALRKRFKRNQIHRARLAKTVSGRYLYLRIEFGGFPNAGAASITAVIIQNFFGTLSGKVYAATQQVAVSDVITSKSPS